MIINKVTQALLDNPKLLSTNYISNPKLVKRFGVSMEDIIKSKFHANSLISAGDKLRKDSSVEYKSLKEIFSFPEPKVVNSDRDLNTGITKTNIKSPKPLTPTELNELTGVDGINNYIARVWDKSNKNGTEWDYSIDIRSNVKDFYNKEELQEKLKELFPKQDIYRIPKQKKTSDKTLVIYISDDHVGMLIKNSLFGNDNSQATYIDRLDKIIDYVVGLDEKFEEVVLVSLGDQTNSWSENTTRGGHIVPSTTNREQFDSYVSSRKYFYDQLFTSQISENYTVIEVNNSNHVGLGASYIANSYLKLYLELKYPDVEMINEEDFITMYTVSTGQTLVMFHGKDEKHQKAGFPLNLDTKTEVYFTDYILEQGLNPKLNHIHLIKGDLHRYNCNQGKSFTYTNIPAISNGSDWEEHNFGNRKAAAVVDIFLQYDSEPIRKVLKF